MKKLISILVFSISFVLGQNAYYQYFTKYPQDWNNILEITLDISKKENIYEGENVVLYMHIKNISNETQLIPLIFIRPLVKNLNDNKNHENTFFEETDHLILIPGEEATKFYTGSYFFWPYHQSTHLKGFPAGEYLFYTVNDQNNDIRFKINKTSDAESFAVVKELMDIRTKNINDRESFYNKILEETDSIEDPICKSIVNSRQHYRLIAKTMGFNKTTDIDKVKVFVLDYSQYAESIYLIKNAINYGPKSKILFDDNFANKIKNEGLRKYILWKNFKINNKDLKQNESRTFREHLHKKMRERGVEPAVF